MQQLFFIVLVLACPLSMFFMMRGMHGGKGASHDMSMMHGNDDAKDERLAILEREVSELRSSGDTPRDSGPHAP